MTDLINLRTDGAVAEVVLNKPDKKNALCNTMWAAIPDLIGQAVANPEVRVLLLHGGGNGVFAAGADISEFDTAYGNEGAIHASGRLMEKALSALEHCAKPVIAAVNGPCYGAGVALAVACDFRVASETARFCVPPAKLGLTFPAGDTRRLLGLVGPGLTRDMLLTARVVNASDALTLGLVERLCEDDAIMAARSLATAMAELSPTSHRLLKTMVHGVLSGWGDDAPEADTLFVEGFSSEDHTEGRAAFSEKRRPIFKGR
ncbi:MAG: enoyl-CoA hydratase-related protein [Pseudomonadota bacterium]